MVAVSSSSLDTSETSVTSPNTDAPPLTITAAQKGMHARDWEAWYATHSKLRHSGDEALMKRGIRIAACCCCPIYCLTSNARLRLAPGYCRDRICPTCSHQRARKTFHVLCAHVARMDSPRFITLTQKAKPEPLFLSLARLRANIRTLRRNPIWTAAVKGGVYSIEVTRNEQTNLWHVHAHLIVDGDFIAQRRLSEAWKASSGDSYIVDIRAIHSKATVAAYITKYISKPAALTKWPAAAFFEYARDMAGVRMVHTFGNAHDRQTEPGDDGCVIQSAEPLASSATILRRLRLGCPRAAHAVHLINRMGGNFRRSLGLPQPPEDEPLDPLTPTELEELIDHLRSLAPHQSVTEIPRSVWRAATLRCECPWS